VDRLHDLIRRRGDNRTAPEVNIHIFPIFPQAGKPHQVCICQAEVIGLLVLVFPVSFIKAILITPEAQPVSHCVRNNETV